VGWGREVAVAVAVVLTTAGAGWGRTSLCGACAATLLSASANSMRSSHCMQLHVFQGAEQR
jgi:hypothetical protein